MADARSNLVHSTLSVAEVEGELVAVLRSATEQRSSDGLRVVLTLDRLKACHAELSRVVNGLSQALEQAGPQVSRG
jgi:hypothetical protein